MKKSTVALVCTGLAVFIAMSVTAMSYVRRVAYASSKRTPQTFDAKQTAPALKIPNGPGVHTQKQFNQELSRYYQRTMIDAYSKVGVCNPKWNAAAIRFLHEYTDSQLPDPGKPIAQHLEEHGKEAIDLGCTDPLVQCCYGIILSDKYDSKADQYLKQAVEGFQHSNYPKCQWRIPAFRLLESLQSSRPANSTEIEKFRDLAIKWTVESFSDGSYLKGEDRAIIQTFCVERPNSYAFKQTLKDHWVELYSNIKNAGGAFPYATNVIGGICYTAAAWNDRGTGWSDSVSDQGWNGFFDKLRTARSLLVKAWKMRPDCPEAPAQMITVAMGEDTGEKPLVWFNRSVACQMDYFPAYSAITNALRPRCGGSYEEMYSLGVAALMTKRFDTYAPWQFITILKQINADQHAEEPQVAANTIYDRFNAKPVWKTPETTRYLEMMYKGYEKAGGASSAAFYLTREAAVAWYCGRFADARKIFDKLGDKVDLSVFGSTVYYPSYADVREDAYLLGGPCASLIRQARELTASGQSSEAAAVYHEALAKLKDDKIASDLINAKIANFEGDRNLLADNWISLMPDQSMSGWIAMDGKWTTDSDGSLHPLVANGIDACQLLRRAQFGPRVEIRGKLIVPKELEKFVVLLNCPDPEREDIWSASYTGIIFFPKAHWVQKGRQGTNDQEDISYKVQFKDQCDFLIQRWDDDVWIYVDGVLIAKPIKIQECSLNGKQYVGVAMSGNKGGFRNLEIRRLDKKPE